MRQLFFVLILVAWSSSYLLAQQGQVEFGKNRVQYHDRFDEWMKYETRNFITIWYGTGRKIAETVAAMAEVDYPYIRDFIDFIPPDKIRILVYTDLSDLKQSNLGDDEQFVTHSGKTLIRKNKIFVYFDGDHQHLRKQIREGLVKVFLQNMIIGQSWQEIVQNAALLNLPDWYVEGLASFIASGWSGPETLRLHNELQRKRNNDFFDVAARQPSLAGKSFFYFLYSTYGKKNLSNLIYLTRLNRSLETAFIHVYGLSLADASEEWRNFFINQYERLEKDKLPFDESRIIPVKNKHKAVISSIRVSPDGKQVLYVLNDIGRVKVYSQNLLTGKRKLIFKKGFRNPFQATDYNYPGIAWRPDGKVIAIVYKYRDVLYLARYDFNSGKTKTEEFAPGFQNVHSIDFVDARTLAVSATVNGFSDIFLYYPSKRQARRITSDIWDDLDVRFTRLRGQNGLVFISNRPDSLLTHQKLDTILPIGDFDVFYYNLDSVGNELVQITHTDFFNERAPMAVDTHWVAYLSDRSGIYNREIAYLKDQIVGHERHYRMKSGVSWTVPADSIVEDLDSTLVDTTWVTPVWRPVAHTVPTTRYGFGLEAQSYQNQTLVALTDHDNRLVLIRDTFRTKPVPANPFLPVQLLEEKNPANTTLEESPSDTTKADYYFVTRFGDIKENVEDSKEAEKIDRQKFMYVFTNPGSVEKFHPSRVTPQRIRFRLEYFTSEFDNSLLFGGLDSYAGTPGQFSTPPPGILLKANFKDLFEDYVIEGGMRFNLGFNRAEYFMQYWDKKHRLDRQYGIYLRRERITDNGINFFIPRSIRNQTFIATSQWRYPLDIYRSFRATATLRTDRYLEAATDTFSLRSDIVREKRAGIKVEYVFDNTYDVYTNIKNGSRYKLYFEFVKKYNLDLTDGFEFALNKGFMGVAGFDARHYQRLLKHSIFASRLAGGTSFGTEKLLYIMGGTNNWLLPQYDINTPIPQGNFAYRTLVADMRGFRQNIRNGNSFLLMNQELRIPIFRYLSRRPAKSNFFNNIQLVGFVDAGIAWVGKDPFNTDNPLNTHTITITDNSPVPILHLKIKYFRDPLVAGYGVGLRTILFGYPMRFDMAWGFETRTILKPKLHISLGTDF